METREDLLAAVTAAFPGRAEAVLAELDRYGVESYERERVRVQLAIVQLAKGDEVQITRYVEDAKVDYRDVLSWVETGPLDPAQAEALQAAARDVLARWGKK